MITINIQLTMPRKSNVKTVQPINEPINEPIITAVIKKTRVSKKNKTENVEVPSPVVTSNPAVVAPVVAPVVVAPVVAPVVVAPAVVAPVVVIVDKPKRGRKSKKELLASLNISQNVLQLQVNEIENGIIDNGINDNGINDNGINNIITNNIIIENDDNVTNDIITENNDNLEDDTVNLEDVENKKIVKKRGRKPKGGKIIQQVVLNETQKIERPNIILHLKCSLKDLQQEASCAVESYNFSSELAYDTINEKRDNKSFNTNSFNTNSFNTNSFNTNSFNTNSFNTNLVTSNSNSINDIKGFNISASINNNNNNNNNNNDYDDESESDLDNKSIKDVWRKLKQLEHNLHINNVNNKKSACFWCTCDFDNPPIYVPKHFINGTYHVYGCFCSPECGVAHLMNEPIDSSAKFERYHLLNHIYSKIYDYKKNIKPAPNPYYMLEKFYGNLSIQEYRSLLRNERLFLIVDKPLTRILPELHEDNDEFILNNKIIASNNYQLKSRMQKKPNKGLIMNEKFGLAV